MTHVGWDALDDRMVRIARVGGRVLVQMPTGTEVSAVLLRWRPPRAGARARVRFDGGAEVTVATDQVRPIPDLPVARLGPSM